MPDRRREFASRNVRIESEHMHPKSNVRTDSTPRVMWLLNHTSARKFEVRMLRRLGFEVFTPKSYPADPAFRSASIDYSEDANLTIPADELEIMNGADWYAGANKRAWEIANKYFDIVFFIVFQPRASLTASRRFNGALLWRAYGLSGEGASYSNTIETMPIYEDAYVAIQKGGRRFWFAEAYPHLHEIEKPYLADRAVYLPLGMSGAEKPISDAWNGSDASILFVCPDVGYNPVYIDIYKKFKKDFKGFPYAIAGAQSVAVQDPTVLGYLPGEEYARNMREMRVMFYHSQEPRHIHFHPFEALKAGMPLVFMSGGILDLFGGRGLPGRCTSIDEARRKIRKILDGDTTLIEQIRRTQSILLEPMKEFNCIADWERGLNSIMADMRKYSQGKEEPSSRAQRIAILCDKQSAAKARHMAQTLQRGAQLANKHVEIVVGVEKNADEDLSEFLKSGVAHTTTREFVWRRVELDEASRILAYSGTERNLQWPEYLVPDDGINNFLESDLWVLIASEIDSPLLPLRPLVLSPDSIAHRFVRRSPKPAVGHFGLAYLPEAVLVDSKFAEAEFIQCEGVPKELVSTVPTLLFDEANERTPIIEKGRKNQFLWIINPRSIPNIEASVEALSILYNQLGFTKHCRVLVADVVKTALRSERHPEFKNIVAAALKENHISLTYVSIEKVASARRLYQELSEAEFLWRPGKLDDDLLPIISFALSHKPILAARCPLLVERLSGHDWGVIWMDGESPDEMAAIANTVAKGVKIQSKNARFAATDDNTCTAYWEAIYECL